MKKPQIKAVRREAYNYASIGTMTTLFIIVTGIYIFASVAMAFYNAVITGR